VGDSRVHRYHDESRPDLYSWFILRLELQEIIRKPIEFEFLREEHWKNIDEARKKADYLQERFTNALKQYPDIQDLFNYFIAPIVKEFQQAKDDTEAHKRCHQLIDQLIKQKTAEIGSEELIHELNHIAAEYRKQGDFIIAEEILERLIELCEKVFGEHHANYANSLANLATIYLNQSLFDKSEMLLNNAYDLIKNSDVKESKTKILKSLSVLYHKQGDIQKAESIIKELLIQNEQGVLPQGSLDADILNTYGLILESKGEYHKALDFFQKALTQAEYDNSDSDRILYILDNIGNLYQMLGQYNKAEEYNKLALELTIKEGNTEGVARNKDALANIYKKTKRYEEAEKFYKQSCVLYSKILGEDHPEFLITQNNLAGLYIDMGRYEEAEELYLRTLHAREKVFGNFHPDYATSLNNLAYLYNIQGKFKEAEPLFNQAFGIAKETVGENHPDYARALNNLAAIHCNNGRYKDGLPLMNQAIEIWERTLGKDHNLVKTAFHNKAQLLKALGQNEESESLQKKIDSM
jgi:tetratricopeptide (TPR) repeat protein